MRIVTDENIPARSIRALSANGHDVTDVRSTEYAGSNDARLWQFVQQRQAVLVTTDRGFARRRSERHYGVLIVRLRQPNRERIHERIMLAFELFTEGEWPGMIVEMRDRTRSVRRGPRATGT